MVIGRADLLLSDVNGPLNPDQRRSVEAILEAAERLKRDLEELADEIDPRPDDGGSGAG